jgi:hypothetical protein
VLEERDYARAGYRSEDSVEDEVQTTSAPARSDIAEYEYATTVSSIDVPAGGRSEISRAYYYRNAAPHGEASQENNHRYG